MAGNQRLNATITIGGVVSATLGKAVETANARLGSIGRGLGSMQNNIGTAIRRNDAALDKARAGLVDAAGAYYTLKSAIGAPIRAAANFETVLEDIGQKADVPVEKLGELGDKIKSVAHDTNMGAMQIGAAVDALAGRGASLDVALTASEPIGRAAVAYRAATDDLAAASWAAVDNLKVPANQIENALDAMAQAGKDGAFELRDMATYFPSLGAAYQGLGQKGVPAVADLAAALQVVRKGTGDASTAATNLQNVLQKVYAPATIKRFGEAGVDVHAEMEAAAKRGLTPIEAIAELTDKTLGGDLSKMGTLFEDAQVQAGMRSLIQGLKEYRDIRAKAMGADGVVDEDYQRRIETAQGAMDRWNQSVENLSLTIGATLIPVLNNALDRVVPIIGKVGEWAATNPELASTIATTTAGVVAFRGAVAAIRFVGLLGKGGALQLLSIGMSTVGAAGVRLFGAAKGAIALQTALGAMNGQSLGILGKVSVGLRAMIGAVPGLGAVATAIRGISATLLANPIGLTIGAIAGAAYLIYRNWDSVGPWFGRLWGNVRTVFTGFGEFVSGVFTGDIGRAWEGIKTIWNGMTGYWKTIWDGVTGVFTAAWNNYIAPVLNKLGLLEPIMAAWEGLKTALGSVIDWIGAKFDWVLGKITPVMNALQTIDEKGAAAVNSVTGGYKGPISTGPYTGGATGPIVPPPIPARAVGGPFGAGPVLVGERGPEVRFEERAGFIATNRQLGHMAGMAARIAALGGALAGAPAAALPIDDLLPSAARMGSGASGSSNEQTIDIGGITIIAQQGQDPRQIADEVLRVLQARARGALFDGGF